MKQLSKWRDPLVPNSSNIKKCQPFRIGPRLAKTFQSSRSSKGSLSSLIHLSQGFRTAPATPRTQFLTLIQFLWHICPPESLSMHLLYKIIRRGVLGQKREYCRKPFTLLPHERFLETIQTACSSILLSNNQPFSSAPPWPPISNLFRPNQPKKPRQPNHRDGARRHNGSHTWLCIDICKGGKKLKAMMSWWTQFRNRDSRVSWQSLVLTVPLPHSLSATP